MKMFSSNIAELEILSCHYGKKETKYTVSLYAEQVNGFNVEGL